MPRWFRRAAASLLASCALAASARAVTFEPTDFIAENAVFGTAFTAPTAFVYLPGGRMLVCEKAGLVWSVTNGVRHPTPMWNRQNEVLNQGDRGLLAIAVDPNYVQNRFVYLLYTVDPDSNGVDTNSDGFGRLTRYQVSASDSNLLNPASRTIFFGRNWTEGPLAASPSHTIGDMQFGSDGSLLVSTGDGAQFDNMDDGGDDGQAFGAGKTDPFEDIGAFRSQYIGSLCGKILRINPVTGAGYAGNPYATSNLHAIQSKVWAYGVRNPYRICLRPGTGSADTAAASPGALYIGDVGWNIFEEMNVVSTDNGPNFGWPCREGTTTNSYLTNGNPSHHGCGTIGTGQNPGPLTTPNSAWHHGNANQSSPPGFTGNTSIGGAFYTGTSYPLEWRNKYFFADYGQSWIKVADMNGSNQVQSVVGFATGMDGPVDLQLEPGTSNLMYIAINVGEIRRIRYTGFVPGGPPVAVANASNSIIGVAPHQVNFSSAGSFDPEQGPITYAWNFGDGQGSTSPNPSHTYNTPGKYLAILTVTDNQSTVGRDSVGVVALANATVPHTAVVDNFNRANGPIGGQWVDPDYGLAGLSIDNNALTQSCCYATPVWTGGSFGPDQEAYITLSTISPGAPEQDLMLKVQGQGGGLPHIEIRYDAAVNIVMINTFDYVNSWKIWNTYPTTFAPGDRLGARAYSNGVIAVYKNSTLLGAVSAHDWMHAGDGGYLGLTLSGAHATRFEDFGGGNLAFTSNTPPTCSISSPVDSSFFVEGDIIQLDGTASDAEQSSGSLNYLWVVDLHHNTHTHPSTYVLPGPTNSFEADNHDDGTGVWFEVRLQVTDNGALTDTARVDIFPEVDLQPGEPAISPTAPDDQGTALYRFLLVNNGRMPAPNTRWRIRADNTLLAEGDTLVGPQSSVMVERYVTNTLPVGPHTLRVTADTLAQSVETDETNNAATKAIEVVEDGGPTEVPDTLPRAIALSVGRPNPSSGRVVFGLELPRGETVGFSVHDIQGREVWRTPARHFEAGRRTLEWSGTRVSGGPAGSGVYLARVEVGGRVFMRRIVLMR